MRSVYHINECFYSLQGEGHRTGSANVFLRFAFCNLQCVDAKKLARPLRGTEIDAGFHCDTDFAKGEPLSIVGVMDLLERTDTGNCKNVILTGGEPTMQADDALVFTLREAGYYVAIETNGTRPVPKGVNWISCSPKRGSRVVLQKADEIRIVVQPGDEPDAHNIQASHFFVSPAFDAPTADSMQGWTSGPRDARKEAMEWAVGWCLKHPAWRLSLQTHKILDIR